MDCIKVHDKTFVPFIDNAQISKAIDKVAEKINHDYANCDSAPILVCVLNGSVLFTGELMQRLNFPCELTCLRIKSYEGTQSTGVTKQVLGLNRDITGKQIIVIEDIVDTGHTIEFLHNTLLSLGASDVKICTLLLKPEVYDRDIKLDYVAMEIPNKFILGFGLDYDELGRNSKDIYVLQD